jgi:hypothetical protein
MEIYVPVVFKTNIDVSAMPELKKYDEIRMQWAGEQSVYEILDFLIKNMNENATFARIEYIKPVNVTESSASFQAPTTEPDWEDELNHLIKQYKEESDESDGLH